MKLYERECNFLECAKPEELFAKHYTSSREMRALFPVISFFFNRVFASSENSRLPEDERRTTFRISSEWDFRDLEFLRIPRVRSDSRKHGDALKSSPYFPFVTFFFLQIEREVSVGRERLKAARCRPATASRTT